MHYAMGDHETLRLRQTRKYVGAYKHLDSWEDLALLEIIGTKTEDLNAQLPDDSNHDECEPFKHTFFCHVVEIYDATTNGDAEKIKQAFSDTFTSVGCGHEYDCCGCRSYSVACVEPIANNVYKVTVGSSRNF